MTRLKPVIELHKHLLQEPAGTYIDAGALLGAIAHCESASGLQREYGRREPAYAKGGRYYVRHVIDLHKQYGDFVPLSYGSWQVLFIAAWELGYKDHPSELLMDDISLPWVIKFINIRAFDRGASTPKDVFDTYNSGNYKDDIVPFDYISKAMDFYNENIGNF